MTSLTEFHNYGQERDDESSFLHQEEKMIREMECRIEDLENCIQEIIDVCEKGVPITFIVDIGKAVANAKSVLADRKHIQ